MYKKQACEGALDDQPHQPVVTGHSHRSQTFDFSLKPCCQGRFEVVKLTDRKCLSSSELILREVNIHFISVEISIVRLASGVVKTKSLLTL